MIRSSMTSTIAFGEVPALYIISNAWPPYLVLIFCDGLILLLVGCNYYFMLLNTSFYFYIQTLDQSFLYINFSLQALVLMSQTASWIWFNGSLIFRRAFLDYMIVFSVAWSTFNSLTFCQQIHDRMAPFWFGHISLKESLIHSFRVEINSDHLNWRVSLAGEYLSIPRNPDKSKGFMSATQIIASPMCGTHLPTQLIWS